MGWHSDPIARPEFSKILVDLEKFAPSDDSKQFIIGPPFNDSTSAIGEESETDMDDDCTSDVGDMKTVTRLKNRWEQLSINDVISDSPPRENGPLKNGNIEKLSQRVDHNGYVSQAKRAVINAKEATQLRDSIVLARSVTVAQRQNAFKKVDQSRSMSFTTGSPTLPVMISMDESDSSNASSPLKAPQKVVEKANNQLATREERNSIEKDSNSNFNMT